MTPDDIKTALTGASVVVSLSSFLLASVSLAFSRRILKQQRHVAHQATVNQIQELSTEAEMAYEAIAVRARDLKIRMLELDGPAGAEIARKYLSQMPRGLQDMEGLAEEKKSHTIRLKAELATLKDSYGAELRLAELLGAAKELKALSIGEAFDFTLKEYERRIDQAAEDLPLPSKAHA